MGKLWHQRATLHLKELAADFIERTSNRTSLVTVTNLVLSEDEQRALILLSVIPDEKGPAVVDFANRQLADFRDYIHEHSRLHDLPKFTFAIDKGEQNRQRIDELSAQQ